MVLINSFVCLSFHHSSQIYHFAQSSLLEKLRKLKRNLELSTNDFDSAYKVALDTSGKFTMEVKYFRASGLEIYNTLNKFISAFIEEIL